jgi:pyridoxal biosynthesis lyase PdxS
MFRIVVTMVLDDHKVRHELRRIAEGAEIVRTKIKAGNHDDAISCRVCVYRRVLVEKRTVTSCRATVQVHTTLSEEVTRKTP